MFRSQAEPITPLDEIIKKATDENLTSENWEYIINVCDAVNDDPESGAVNAIVSLEKRLKKPNANVQLYSLTLLSSLAQNCGSKIAREIASKRFTSLLLKLTQDKAVHHTVKSKILECMENLSHDFKSDPSLRLMEDSYKKLKESNPNLAPPQKPEKHQITVADKEREEEELQMVLALSLSEAPQQYSTNHIHPNAPTGDTSTNNGSVNTKSSLLKVNPIPRSNNRSEAVPANATDSIASTAPTNAQGSSAVTVSKVKALYDLNSTESGELSFRKGDVITVLESVYRDWWRGSLRGQVGIFPLNYVVPVAEPTKEEIEREAAEEAKVFEQAINIEKLLSLLTNINSQRDKNGYGSTNIAEDEDLQNLYHSTVSIRPKLVKLIDKYSQKKDDLIGLNEKFVTARKTYDKLMEDALSKYRQQQNQMQPQSYLAPYPKAPGGPNTGYPVQHQVPSNPPYPTNAGASLNAGRKPISSTASPILNSPCNIPQSTGSSKNPQNHSPYAQYPLSGFQQQQQQTQPQKLQQQQQQQQSQQPHQQPHQQLPQQQPHQPQQHHQYSSYPPNNERSASIVSNPTGAPSAPMSNQQQNFTPQYAPSSPYSGGPVPIQTSPYIVNSPSAPYFPGQSTPSVNSTTANPFADQPEEPQFVPSQPVSNPYINVQKSLGSIPNYEPSPNSPVGTIPASSTGGDFGSYYK